MNISKKKISYRCYTGYWFRQDEVQESISKFKKEFTEYLEESKQKVDINVFNQYIDEHLGYFEK